MDTLALYTKLDKGIIVGQNGKIIFNRNPTIFGSGIIAYDNSTGEATITTPGLYLVSFSVNTECLTPLNTISLTLRNITNAVDIGASKIYVESAYVNKHIMSLQSLVSVVTFPIKVALINTSLVQISLNTGILTIARISS